RGGAGSVDDLARAGGATMVPGPPPALARHPRAGGTGAQAEAAHPPIVATVEPDRPPMSHSGGRSHVEGLDQVGDDTKGLRRPPRTGSGSSDSRGGDPGPPPTAPVGRGASRRARGFGTPAGGVAHPVGRARVRRAGPSAGVGRGRGGPSPASRRGRATARAMERLARGTGSGSPLARRGVGARRAGAR